jgi:UDP-N-acetylglucosamine 2-epimerase (non-hydrolysing)
VKQESIADGLKELLSNPHVRQAMTTKQNPYGDGKAAQRIADILESRLLKQA